MSLLIQHQQQRIADLNGQLNYVDNILTNHGDELEPWEAKEYQSLKSDYQNEIARLNNAINRAMRLS